MNFLQKIILVFYLYFLVSPINGQELFKDKNIDSSFLNYTKKSKEIAYSHLNKSTYIVGEEIGFTSYIINNRTNSFFELSKNLYCVIKDKDGKTIKEQLVKVRNGIAHNSITIDSLFTTGEYKFFAFTNWMLNFKQQNYYTEVFNVIDSKVQKTEKKFNKNTTIDIQFLPEGGHLLNNTISKVGVIAKDSLGHGIPNIKGNLLDENKDIITTFSLNELGIGRFSFLPIIGKKYTAQINYNNQEKSFKLNHKIAAKGVRLKISENTKEAIISLISNEETVQQLNNKKFTVSIHNGNKIALLSFNLTNKISSIKRILLETLPTGINIFTLFNENNQPVSERLFFNYKGLSVLNSTIISSVKKGDSVAIRLSYNDLKIDGLNNVSVSVLPYQTKSYTKNSNIITQTLLRPYLNGIIENGSYYFKNISPKKKYDLDNLLITQGWSSYDWTDIFNNNPTYSKIFEQGITVQLNTPNSSNENNYLIQHSTDRSSEIVVLKKGEKSYTSLGFFPVDKENIYISSRNKKGKLLPANLYLQFEPTRIPEPKLKPIVLSIKPSYYSKENYKDGGFNRNSLDNTLQLKEVVLKTNLEKIRIEKIKNKSMGQVYFFDEDSPFINFDVFAFLRTKGFVAEKVPASDQVILRNLVSSSLRGSNVPIVFIDDFPIPNLNQLSWLDTSIIDHIEINRSGFGEGIRGGNGVIRIVTDPFKRSSRKSNTTRKFKFPLTFSTSKKFYTPIYENYNSKFYSNYGVIDWLPINSIDKNGVLNLSLKNEHTNAVKLFIEGITNNGEFISETKEVILK